MERHRGDARESCLRWTSSRALRRRIRALLLAWALRLPSEEAALLRPSGVKGLPGLSARPPRKPAHMVLRPRSSRCGSDSLPGTASWPLADLPGGSFASSLVRPTWWRPPTPKAMVWAMAGCVGARRRSGRGRRGRSTRRAVLVPIGALPHRVLGPVQMRSFFGRPRAIRAPHHERSAMRWSARTWYWCTAWQRSRDCCRARLLGPGSPLRRSPGASRPSTCPSWSASWRRSSR